jgi:hypothetical protein
MSSGSVPGTLVCMPTSSGGPWLARKAMPRQRWNDDVERVGDRSTGRRRIGKWLDYF